MFILPFPKSPGEHRAEDDTAGLIARPRRSFPLNIHMGVNGFIVAALLIQAVSIAGVIPTEVWLAKPGYAFTVCIGLVALSACILFSLRSLLMQSPNERADKESHPSASAPAAPAPSQTQQPERHEAPRPAGTEPSALVIAGNRTTEIIVEKSLRTAGIRCVCIDEESAARQALASRKFDLLIVDAAWSNSTAPRDSNGETPILVLTSDHRGSAQFAADASVMMPIAPHALARTALELIARAPDALAAAAEPAPFPPHREAPKLEPEPLDARALGDLQKLGGAEFVRDIVAQFVADAATVLASLASAISERDTKAFREQAHALRSCAANVGAQNVYRMCLAWRDLDAQEIAASGAQYMQMLEAEFERVRCALAPMLEPGGGEPGPDSKAA